MLPVVGGSVSLRKGAAKAKDTAVDPDPAHSRTSSESRRQTRAQAAIAVAVRAELRAHGVKATAASKKAKKPAASTGRLPDGSYQIGRLVDFNVAREFELEGSSKMAAAYRVHWLGWPTEYDSWEEASELSKTEGGRLEIRLFQKAARNGSLPVPHSVTSGIYAHQHGDNEDSECNTLKEEQRALENEHTAGLLAAVYTCGIYADADELYRSESRAQICMFLYNLLVIVGTAFFPYIIIYGRFPSTIHNVKHQLELTFNFLVFYY
jgi:hypothetical protein